MDGSILRPGDTGATREARKAVDTDEARALPCPMHIKQEPA
jgi:hypothetical protein